MVALFPGQCQADQAAAMRRHEVDDLRRNFLGSNRKIALILAIFIVDDDQDPPGANLLDSLRNADKRHIFQ